MIKKLMMLCVAAMAATGFAEIWTPRASEIQFEAVKLPDGTSSGLLVTGSNAVAKVKLEQFSPGWRVFDEEYDEYLGLRAQRHVIEKIILVGYPGAVLNDLPMPKLSDYMPNGWNQEGYLEYQKQYNKAARMFKEDSFGNILHISPANNRIEFEFQLAPIDAIASSYRIIHSGEVNIGQIEFDDSSNICSNKNWFLLPFVLPNGKGYHGEYYWTAHVVYSDYHKQANEEGDGYLWSEDIITSPNMEKEDEEGSKCQLLITNELGRVFFDKLGKDYNGEPNWFTYWKDDGACPCLQNPIYPISCINLGMYGNAFSDKGIIQLDHEKSAGQHYDRIFTATHPDSQETYFFSGPHIWGIYTVEEVVAHEAEHIKQYRMYNELIDMYVKTESKWDRVKMNCLGSWQDDDKEKDEYGDVKRYIRLDNELGMCKPGPLYCDYLLNWVEDYLEYKFDSKNLDTYNIKRKNPEYEAYGDNEFLSMIAANKATEEKRAKPENDWAFPGEQSWVPENVRKARKAVDGFKEGEGIDNPWSTANIAKCETEESNENSECPKITVKALSKRMEYEGDLISAVSYVLDVAVASNEKVQLNGVMTDENSNIVARATAVVTSEETSVELRFKGSDIYRSRKSGPYKLHNVTFSQLTDWEPAQLASVTQFKDAEIDVPRDKLSRDDAYLLEVKNEFISIEGIVLSVDVDLKTAGDCRVLATLTTTGGVRVAKANVVKKCIAGKNSIEVVFPVSDVFESMQNGPYKVNSIELFKDGVRMDAYTDFYDLKKLYKYESFDYDEDTEDFDGAEFISQFEDYVPEEVKPAETFLVIFSPNGGKITDSIKEYAKDEVLGELIVPTKSNAEFLGWYTATNGGERVSSSTRVTADALYFAHWSNNDPVKISYTVTFDANGGVVSPLTHSVEHNMVIGNLPTPTRSKYKFLGWYTAPEGGTKISATTKVTGDVTYYAQWVYDGSATVSVVVADGCVAMGKVTGGKTAKAGTKLTLKATANKGYVFSYWEGPLGDAQDSRNPSISYVVGEDDAEFVARFIPVEDDVAAISFTMSKECENGVAIDNVAIDVSGCTSLPTVKVAGLPAGLKFTAKDIFKNGSKTEVEVPANTIYGTPTKSGVYTVGATATTAGKKTATCSQTVIVRKEGEKVVVAECDATGGKVTGGGVYAEGKNAALKATANKGYVFAGWYYSTTGGSPVDGVNAQAARSTNEMWPSDLKPCDSTLVDYRNPNYSYVMGVEDKTFYARFEPSAADTNLNLMVGGVAITPEDTPLKSFTVGSATNLPLVIDSLSLPKAAVKGLPAGMKFTDKPVYKKGSKTEIEVPANTIYGIPTKPGVYKVSISLTNTSIKEAIVNDFEIVVPNLTDALVPVEDGYGPYVPGVAYTNTIVVAADCAVSGLPAGMKWTAKDILDNKTKQVVVPANSAYGAPTKPGKYTVYFTKTIDKVKHTATATFIVGEFPIVNVVTSVCPLNHRLSKIRQSA